MVLHLAGVLGGDLVRYAQQAEETGDHGVAVIDLPGNGETAVRQGEGAVTGHEDMAAFPEFFHGDADAGLGVA